MCVFMHHFLLLPSLSVRSHFSRTKERLFSYVIFLLSIAVLCDHAPICLLFFYGLKHLNVVNVTEGDETLERWDGKAELKPGP